jgi:regulator of sigma E protease
MEIQNILWGILGLSIVVVAHEAGHFVAARLAGIDVEVFSIGWGKRLVGFRRGETDYRLSILPLGGYCKLKGEKSLIQAWESDSDTIPYEEGAFYSAPTWKRIIVSLAGPVANLVFSVLILMTIAWIGYTETYQEPRIVLASEWTDDRSDWPADLADLESGDTILAVDGRPIRRYSELREGVALSLGEEVTLTVQRRGNIGYHRCLLLGGTGDRISKSR